MYSRPTFWLEFRLLSDGLQTAAVHTLPLTAWHEANTPVFSLFSALPAELRLKVWEYLIAPRIVGIACLCLEDGASSVESQREELWGPHPPVKHPVPVLLHINRETRALALRHYELSFEWKVPRVLAGADMHPPVPMRSPILAAPTLPAMPGSAGSGGLLPGTTNNDHSLSHISSYHDLLDPSPGSSTLGVGGGGRSERRTAESASRINGHAAISPSSPSTTGGITSAPTTNSTIFSPERRTSSPPRTWFNFALDAVYLLGELEPCDSFGFNSPMTYFIPSQTARRVRKAAVSFGALRYGETGGQQIFGALFHVVDRFPPEEGDGEVLVCVTERDEWTHAMMGHDTGLVDGRYRRHVGAGAGADVGAGGRGDSNGGSHNNGNSSSSSGSADDGGGGSGTPTPSAAGQGQEQEGDGNVIQKIWRDWYRGAIVTSPLRNLRFSLIPENDLEHHVYDYMITKRVGKHNSGKGKRTSAAVER